MPPSCSKYLVSLCNRKTNLESVGDAKSSSSTLLAGSANQNDDRLTGRKK